MKQELKYLDINIKGATVVNHFAKRARITIFYNADCFTELTGAELITFKLILRFFYDNKLFKGFDGYKNSIITGDIIRKSGIVYSTFSRNVYKIIPIFIMVQSHKGITNKSSRYYSMNINGKIVYEKLLKIDQERKEKLLKTNQEREGKNDIRQR